MPIIISIIICSYNRKELLAHALQALANVDFNPEDYEIVLVDDGSNDGTSEMVQKITFPGKITCHYQKNSGLASARNAGIRLARGEIILFMDDDTFADRRLLAEHCASHQDSSRNIVLGWGKPYQKIK